MPNGPDFTRWREGTMPYVGSELLTSETALEMINAGVQESIRLGVAMVICIVDIGGQLLTLHRMTGAMAFSVDLATGKASTSVRTKQPTHFWNTWFRDGGVAHGMAFPPDFVSVAGGFPLVKEGQLVGALGISGGEWQDIAVAAACISAGGFWDGDVAPALEKAKERLTRGR
jgi:uncharacterized protein GlcG (DUF336 family)